MNQVELSVIVPVHNSGRYIKTCIDSILNQKDCNLEIIVVDDGSTDSTLKVLKQYSDAEMVRVVSQDNEGVSSARNHGISLARASLLTFVDSDDVLLDGAFKEFSGNSSAKSADLVVGGYFSESSQVCHSLTDLDLQTSVVLKREEFLEELLFSRYFSYCWNKIYRKEIIDTHGICFPENIPSGQDKIFNLEYLKYVSTGVFLEDCHYWYRDVEFSKSKKYRSNYFELQDQILEIKKNLVLQWLGSTVSVSKNLSREYARIILYSIANEFKGDVTTDGSSVFARLKILRRKTEARMAEIVFNALALPTRGVLWAFRYRLLFLVYIAFSVRKLLGMA